MYIIFIIKMYLFREAQLRPGSHSQWCCHDVALLGEVYDPPINTINPFLSILQNGLLESPLLVWQHKKIGEKNNISVIQPVKSVCWYLKNMMSDQLVSGTLYLTWRT